MNLTLALVPIALMCLATGAEGQEAWNISGNWTATKEPPATMAVAPEPILGKQLTLQLDGDKLTIVQPARGGAIAVTYPLDGSEVRSRVPGGLCMGDSQTVEAAAREGNALTLTVVGRIPPGGGPVAKLSVKRTLRLASADTLVVEGTVRDSGSETARTVGTVYRRTPEVVSPPTQTSAKVTASIKQLAWLSGVWIRVSGGDERWTPAASGSMLAIGRTIRNGVMSEFEFLCIAERNGGLVYQAMPNGRSPATDFTLTQIDANSATFENPAHDFPKSIRYTLEPDGTLEAVVSGATGEQSLTFRFKREK